MQYDDFLNAFERMIESERDGRFPSMWPNMREVFLDDGLFYPNSATKSAPRHIDVSDGRPANQVETGECANANKEMAEKINELYNEINLKDKDLREARETVHRLQDSVRDFRKRAETAEGRAKRALAKYDELLGEHEYAVRELDSLKSKVNSLLARIRNEEFSLDTRPCRKYVGKPGAGLCGSSTTDDEDFDGLAELIRRIAEG